MYAPKLYKALNGVFCVYKPPNKPMKAVVSALQLKLSDELNTQGTRPVRERVVLHEQNVGSDLPIATTVPDLSDHPLVIGPRYIPEDIDVGLVGALDRDASGVLVMGIGRGKRFLRSIAKARYIRSYHVKGQLGMATLDYSDQGTFVEKSTYHHVTHAKMDKVISKMQAVHQNYMFEAAGVHRQSQEAYDLASKGLLRPATKEAGPVVYGMNCIHFEPPHFTLEIHTINENCQYLRYLIHNLGLELRTTAVCSQVRRIRYGGFSLTHAMLQKHWTTQFILENINFCRPLANWDILNQDIKSRQIEPKPELAQLQSTQFLSLDAE